MASRFHIDQFCAGFSRGDAISQEALVLKYFLRHLGFESEIYCEQFSEKDSALVRHYREYHRNRNSAIVYHHSYHTRILDLLQQLSVPKILIFHNVTPAHYVEPYNRTLAANLRLAKECLPKLTDQFQIALADSHFNAMELEKNGFRNVSVMPVAIDYENLLKGEYSERLHYLQDSKINILFVGRFFPNKKHQDLLKSFYYFKKMHPDSRLILVGSFHPGVRGYTGEINNLVHELSLTESVLFPGMVPHKDLCTIYRNSHLFLSMSEHEGFFVPLVESMHFNLPVLAHSSSAIPETLGNSGVLFHEKNYPAIAEMMEEMVFSSNLRRHIIEAQQSRLPYFHIKKSLSIFQTALQKLRIDFPAELLDTFHPDVHPY